MSPSVPDTDSKSTGLQNDTEVLAPSTNPNLANSAATADHPGGPDPTTSGAPASFAQKHNLPSPSKENANDNASSAQRSVPTPSTAAPAQLADLKVKLQKNLRQFQDFPQKGILFEDIMPLFANPELHENLVSALEMVVEQRWGKGRKSGIDCVVGLESRGFLFGPSLALRLNASFIPVRKAGKLPGKTVTEAYEKEYGTDHFEMQADAIREGQKVLVVDDIIATGGSAAAAGQMVRKLGGELMGYVFLKELGFLKGRDKLDAEVLTLLE